MKLAAFVDDRVAVLKQSVGSLSESHLMMMASLMIADELDEALIQLEEVQEGAATPKPSDHEGTATGPNPLEEKAANALEACASRLESIATRLEGA